MRNIDIEHFNPEDQSIIKAIEELRGKGGEAYSEVGHRNPVRDDTGPLLTALAKLGEPKVMVELGTAYGFSGLHLKLGAPLAALYTVEFDPEVAKQAQETFNHAGATDVSVVSEDSSLFTAAFSKPIDLVFIDHNKGSYLADFKRLESKLTPGALIIADNVNDRRAECGDFVSYVMGKYKNAQILPTEVGLLVARVPRRAAGR